MPAMVWGFQSRRVSAIVVLGILGCAVAIGIRFNYRKPVVGSWLGHTYYWVNGSLQKDVSSGDFLINLNEDGTYEENGSHTSGLWVQRGDVITLTPRRIFSKTPEEHRQKGKDKGRASRAIEILLSTHMKPMVVTYNAFNDRLVYEEPTMRYEYERTAFN